MARLAVTHGLTDIQQEILATVRTFVDKEIIPHAQRLEHADEYPTDIVEGMREMGLFGLTIDEEYGGLGESLLTYALVVEELSRGWMSISGIVNTHFIVAARACGISIRAFELAIAYAQQRETFGSKLAGHQAIAFKLAEMGTKIEAAHALMVNAARLKDSGERNDVEAGMAKLLASEYCAEVTQESFRIHGGYGYSKEYEIERLMREAPFLLIGEGTSEIQKTIISRGLMREYRINQ